MDKATVINQIRIKNYWLFNGDDEIRTFNERLNDLEIFEEWAVSQKILTWNEIDQIA